MSILNPIRVTEASINRLMREHQYNLVWINHVTKRMVTIPVTSFAQAAEVENSLDIGCTGARISRHCEVEGCEVILFKWDRHVIDNSIPAPKYNLIDVRMAETSPEDIQGLPEVIHVPV